MTRPPAWEWSFAEEGALALAPQPDARATPAGAPPDGPRLKRLGRSATVPAMSAPTFKGREYERRRQRQYVRRRQIALALVLVALAGGTLLVSAFGGASAPAAPLLPPVSAARLLPVGPPELQALAHLGTLGVDFPINRARVTAIGYYGSPDGALTLTPIGSQANEGLLGRVWHALIGGGSTGPRWYLLPGGQGQSTSALEVGAAAGTDVYSPVTGTIVGIEKVTLDGAPHGDQIDIQPTNAPSLVVSVSAIAPDPSLAVGGAVTADASKLGEVLDLSPFETQSLSRYTNDAGNHVLIEVHPAATLDVR